MCGICGFNWEDKKIIKEMTDILDYRGPDQYDYYTDALISLGHRRLSIIDLTEKGKQPLCNEEGNIWIIYNGEIYNFKEIRFFLEKLGHVFKSNTDTEVIIHAYEEYGTNCVNLFNGMFAFAIWDSIKKKVIIARDRLGVKPLYYYFNENKLVFASEIKSILLNPFVKKEMNLNAFNQILHYAYVINGETMFKNINELPPGHLMIYDFKSVEIKKYWEIKNNVQYRTEAFFVERLGKLLKESVKKRLVADVPLGASLSGGLDSSSVVAFMSQATDKPIETFTVGFNDESDEFEEAKRIANFFKTNHHEKVVPFEEITKNIAKIIWHMEIPFAKPAVYSTYFLSKEINRNNVIIDLSGEGSDEIFAGYNRYGRDNADKVITSPFTLEEHKNDFFNKEILLDMDSNLKPDKIFPKYLEKHDKKESINAALNFELKNQLPGVQLARVDRMSMAHSHEIRVPFLDYEFVEFGMTIPSYLKWGESKKYILQKAMAQYLPKETINRPKLPFHIPLLKYFQEEFVDTAENILSKSVLVQKNLIKLDKIKEQLRKIKNKELTEDKALRRILFLTNLELFYKIFIEKEISKLNLRTSNFL